ncbi:MAG: class I SAM-dependent methyltransferase [Gemmatimonadetes bacterium]|nr:class I SAM-dependent methyltransferase [Gemmatimonadota bacterium]
MPSEDPATPQAGVARQRQVQRLFSEIAPRYDLLNHVLSLNVDRAWRRRAVDLLRWEHARGGRYLDACAGTFDLALELCGRAGFAGRVVAADFAQPMLREGSGKLRSTPVTPVCGDSLHLPFPADTFDGATVGFGVRNLADLPAGLSELRRVLRPGARLVVLEFTTPPNPLVRWSYLFYFHRILPVAGRVISGHPWAYTYLPESVKEFPGPAELEGLFREVGFGETGHRLLTFGIAALHWGVK